MSAASLRKCSTWLMAPTEEKIVTFKEFMLKFYPDLWKDSYSFKQWLLPRLKQVFEVEGQGALTPDRVKEIISNC